MREFVERRLVWIELAPERLPASAPPLQRALGMLLLPEDQLPACSRAIRAHAEGTRLGAEIHAVIAAILLWRFNGRTVPEIGAMGGIPVDDCTSSVAYREIVGLGHQQGQDEGRQEGRQNEASAIAVLLLLHRFGAPTPSQEARIQAPPQRARDPFACPIRLPGPRRPQHLAEPARRLRGAGAKFMQMSSRGCH